MSLIASSQAQEEPIIIIAVAAFKKRLTIAERHAVRTTDDIYVTDIYDALIGSGYVNFNDDDVEIGLWYVLNYLITIPNVQDANVMTVLDRDSRLAELLVDGTVLEKYNGVL